MTIAVDLGRKATKQTNKLTYILGAQKNRLIETDLLSTHNICFGLEIRKLNFDYAPLFKGQLQMYSRFTLSNVLWTRVLT